jgi:hypothetical protein
MKSLRPFLLACLVASWGSLAHAQSAWKYEQVAQETADDCSIEVDAQGVPHVGYRAFGPQTGAKYAQRFAAGWSAEQVEGTAGVGLDVSLRLDSYGQPKLAFAGTPSSPQVRYAERFGTVWSLLFPTFNFGVRTSLALDNANQPVIAYANANDNMTLYLAKLVGGTWTNTKLTNNSIADVSLVLDAFNRPRLAYIDATAGTLKFARFTGLSWVFETVGPVTVQSYGSAVSLALAPDGRPVIAYDAGNELRLAEKPVGTWVTSLVDGSASALVDSVSLRVDANGDPHIAYAVRKVTQGPLYAELRYARRFSSGVTAWDRQTLDSGYAILNVALALDGNGSAHIAYAWDNALFQLRYTTNAP